jgi:hypothetical protein
LLYCTFSHLNVFTELHSDLVLDPEKSFGFRDIMIHFTLNRKAGVALELQLVYMLRVLTNLLQNLLYLTWIYTLP